MIKTTAKNILENFHLLDLSAALADVRPGAYS
jgi:hypothetical protein